MHDLVQIAVDQDGLIIYNNDDEEMSSYVFVKSQNRFYHPTTGVYLSITAFDLEFAGRVPRRAGRASVYAKSELHIPSVEDVIYYPRVAAGDVFILDHVPYVNGLVPTSIPDTDSNWMVSDAWTTCLKHLHNMFEPADADALLKWMAHNVQKPGHKILWAPIIIGVQGDGKTSIVKMLSYAMGRRNVKHVSPEALDSAFNGYAAGAAVVALEEVRVIGKSRHPIMEKLKPLLTNDVIEVVSKGQDGKQVPNTTNYIALSNHEDALVLDQNDRRWGVMKTRFRDREEMLGKFDDEYWQTLHRTIEENPEQIRGWLLGEDISKFNPHVAPKMTDAKASMIKSSRSGACLEIEGVINTQKGVTSSAIISPALSDALKKNGYNMPRGKALTKCLEELGYVSYHKTVRFEDWVGRVFYRKDLSEDEPTLMEIKAALETIDIEYAEEIKDDDIF
tara:strand:- start:2460 stop:3803 length:1344 start_codon:yes stop_codon:yes gene_type:complete